MAITFNENGTNTPNGAHLEFSYTFPVLKTEDIKVALNGLIQATTKYTIDSTASKIIFNDTSIDSDLQETTTADGKVAGAPKEGVIVKVYRQTDVDSAQAVYAAGSSIRALDLNNNQDQVLYALQEEQNQEGTFASIALDDDAKIKFGNSHDFTIEWDSAPIPTGRIVSNGPIVYDATGHLFINSALDDQNLFEVSNIGVAANRHVFPYTDDSVDLGKSDKEWKDLYVDGTGYIDTVNADSLAVSGVSTFGSNITVSGHTTLDTVQCGYVASDLITKISAPSTIGYDLGQSNRRWDQCHFNDVFTYGDIQLGSDGSTSETIKLNSRFISDILPNGTRDIGASDNRWNKVWTTDLDVSGTSTLVTVNASAVTSTNGNFTLVDINGGTIDGVNFNGTIGNTTPAVGTFTDLTVNGTTTLATNSIDTNEIADDAVTTDKLADSINTEIAANTAKTTNATHSGEVTGATALTIADDVVDEANLKISNAGSDGEFLQKQSGNTGGLTWATVSQTDTTYTHTWQDSSDNAILRLTAGGSGSGNDDLTIVAGDNITLTPNGDDLTIAASGGEITVKDETTTLATAATTLKFTGSGVTASGSGAEKTITIGGGATDFKYLELKGENDTSVAFSAGSASYELVLSGTTTAVSPTAASALLISLNGVIQKPNTGTSIGSNDGFCLDGSSIHFGGNLTAAPDFIIYLEHAGIGSPSDLAVTTGKIADDAVTYDKIQNVSATDRVLGRDSSGAGVIEEISPSSLRTMINVEDGATADQSASDIKTLLNSSGLVDAQIDGSAAIAGSKINPDFGSQAIGGGKISLYDNGSTSPTVLIATDDAAPFALQIRNDTVSNATQSGLKFWQSASGHGNIQINGATAYLPFKISQKKDDTNETKTSLYIDASQNVGIGTDSPTELLSLSQAITTEATLLSLTGTSFGDEEKVFMAYKRGTIELGKIGVEADNAGQAGHLVFETTTSGTSSEKVRISNSGNVGIGTSAITGYSGQSNLFLGGTSNFVTETSAAAGNSLNITHNAKIDADGSWEYLVTDEAANLYFNNGDVGFRTVDSGTAGTDITWENLMTMENGGAVKLFFDGGAAKFETTSYGALFSDNVKFDNPDTAGRDVTWEADNDALHWENNTKATFGAGGVNDLQIYHDGTNSYIANGGDGGILYLQTYGQNAIKCHPNAAVEIFYDAGAVPKFETIEQGSKVNGYFFAYQDYSDSHFAMTNTFHVIHNSAANWSLVLDNSSDTSPHGLYIYYSDDDPQTNNTNNFLQCSDSSASRFAIYGDGSAWSDSAGSITSDETLKENITDATSKLEDIKKLKVRNFNWKASYHPNKSKEKQIGFIAQEVEQVFPDLVAEHDISIDPADENHTPVMKKAIKQDWTPILVKALQEAITKIETLETKVAALEAK